MPNAAAVLITGASTGIGRACAMDLLGRGYVVFAGVRREADADSLHEAAGPERSGRLRTVALDVTSPIDIDGLSSLLAEHLSGGELFGLVNNAGIGGGGPLEFLRLDDLKRVFEVNVFGAIAVTQAALPFLRGAAKACPTRGARIVNISSISGRFAAPFLGPYAASKHALEALSDSLRVELRPAGISVSLIEPGAIDTPIWGKAEQTIEQMWGTMRPIAREIYGGAGEAFAARVMRAAENAIDPLHVARLVARMLESRRPPARRLIGRDAQAMALFGRLTPTRIRDRIVARAMGSAAAQPRGG